MEQIKGQLSAQGKGKRIRQENIGWDTMIVTFYNDFALLANCFYMCRTSRLKAPVFLIIIKTFSNCDLILIDNLIMYQVNQPIKLS